MIQDNNNAQLHPTNDENKREKELEGSKLALDRDLIILDNLLTEPKQQNQICKVESVIDKVVIQTHQVLEDNSEMLIDRDKVEELIVNNETNFSNHIEEIIPLSSDFDKGNDKIDVENALILNPDYTEILESFLTLKLIIDHKEGLYDGSSNSDILSYVPDFSYDVTGEVYYSEDENN